MGSQKYVIVVYRKDDTEVFSTAKLAFEKMGLNWDSYKNKWISGRMLLGDCIVYKRKIIRS